MTQLTDNGAFAIPVPKYIHDPVFSLEQSLVLMISGKPGFDELVIRGFSVNRPSVSVKNTIKLPPGTYEFLFCTESVTEKQADAVVERRKDLKDHPHKGYEPGKLTACWSAIDSLQSLLRSKHIEGNHAIIKIKSK
jgi:hypothetical protein